MTPDMKEWSFNDNTYPVYHSNNVNSIYFNVNLNPSSEEDVENLYGIFDTKDDKNYIFDKIVSHYFSNGVLQLKEIIDNDHFHIL